MTKYDVALWMMSNPKEAAELVYAFQMGTAVHALRDAGRTEDEIRVGFEAALVSSVPKRR